MPNRNDAPGDDRECILGRHLLPTIQARRRKGRATNCNRCCAGSKTRCFTGTKSPSKLESAACAKASRRAASKSVHAIRVIRPSYNSMGASTVTFIDDGSTRCQETHRSRYVQVPLCDRAGWLRSGRYRCHEMRLRHQFRRSLPSARHGSAEVVLTACRHRPASLSRKR